MPLFLSPSDASLVASYKVWTSAHLVLGGGESSLLQVFTFINKSPYFKWAKFIKNSFIHSVFLIFLIFNFNIPFRFYVRLFSKDSRDRVQWVQWAQWLQQPGPTRGALQGLCATWAPRASYHPGSHRDHQPRAADPPKKCRTREFLK